MGRGLQRSRQSGNKQEGNDNNPRMPDIEQDADHIASHGLPDNDPISP
jgi:hypothetical protein